MMKMFKCFVIHYTYFSILSQLWGVDDLSLKGVMRGHKRGIWCTQFSPVDQVSSKGNQKIIHRLGEEELFFENQAFIMNNSETDPSKWNYISWSIKRIYIQWLHHVFFLCICNRGFVVFHYLLLEKNFSSKFILTLSVYVTDKIFCFSVSWLLPEMALSRSGLCLIVAVSR